MEKEIKVSIVIPIYNKEKILSETLKSLFKQTYAENTEFILINDGSTDNSEKICLNFLERYKNIFKIIYKKTCNQGRSSARNLGIDLATGEYLMFLDADDQIEENMIEVMYENIKENNYDMGICGIKYFDENNKLFKIEIPDKKMNEKFFEYNLSCAVWNKIFKTKIIKENKIYFPLEVALAEDLNFVFKFYNYVQEIKLIDKALYKYMDSTNNLLRSYKNTKDVFRMLQDIDSSLEYYNKKDYNLIFKNHCIKKYSSLVMRLVLSNLEYKETYNEFKENFQKYNYLVSIKTKIYFYFSLLKIKIFLMFLPILKKVKYFKKFCIEIRE